MIYIRLHLTFWALIFVNFGFSQSIQVISTGQSASFRGLSVVSDKTVWVSGSKGTIGLSTDGGLTWTWSSIKGYENRDFRDIEAFDGQTAVVMAVAEPAVILMTSDGAKTWKEVYHNSGKGMFLDAMDFSSNRHGLVIGDPINGRFFMAETSNGGRSWKELAPSKLPAADSGEACFAASGTNLRTTRHNVASFITGGLKSRLFWNGNAVLLPLLQGKETTGANSLAVSPENGEHEWIVVGGDFNDPGNRERNCAVSRDGGKTWISPSNPPYGYRSCVEYISEQRLITCGINGVDVSLDRGINWGSISSVGFHVCRKAKKGGAIFLAGPEGGLARLVW